MDNEFEQFLSEIRELLDREDWPRLHDVLDLMRIQDIARALMALDEAQIPRVFDALPRGRKVDVFSYLEPSCQYRLLAGMSPRAARHVLSELAPDDLTALLEDLPPDEVRRLLRLLPFGAVRRALTLLGYPEHSVGRLMTPEFVTVRPDWTVTDSLAHIREHSARGETVNVILVVDEDRHLMHTLPLKHFILRRATDPVEKLPPGPAVSINAQADRTEAARLIQHYDIEVLPVVDDDNVVLGIVTVDDVMDVVEEETTEDFHKFGSVGALNLSLRDAGLSLLYRKRIGWLLVLVALNLVGGAIMAGFAETIEALVVLVVFLPLIIAGGGNAGAQSATLMVRALATGDVEARDWLRLWGRELFVSVALGLTMGLAIALLGFWRGGAELALLVAVAMTLVVTMGSLVGMMLPLILQRLRLDPATASVPLVTSAADIVGILLYFSLAVALLELPGTGG
ncbi:MAG TPA: magnesium transporter [Thioalkalivibrio sp.]|nr:magnesium transporter [Thioalkalivibrio sp.]